VEQLINVPASSRLKVNLPDRKLSAPATEWVMAFNHRHTTRITDGVNSGARSLYTNIVWALLLIEIRTDKGRYFGINISKDQVAGFGSCAVLV